MQVIPTFTRCAFCARHHCELEAQQSILRGQPSAAVGGDAFAPFATEGGHPYRRSAELPISALITIRSRRKLRRLEPGRLLGARPASGRPRSRKP
jgi:hypothetical protein